MRMMMMLATAMMLCGCTHISGVVIDDVTGKGLSSAVIAVGRPDGIAGPEVHHVDGKGRFDISIVPTDENNLYVYDGAGVPQMTMRRIDRRELGTAMTLRVHRAAEGPMEIPANIP